MGKSAVIFDLDGTLTRPYLDFDVIRAEIGVESGPVLEAMDRMNEADRGRATEILARHEHQAAKQSTLYDGAAETLARLRARGHPVAILTRNARRSVNVVLIKHGLVVDAVRTREDGAVKPSAEPILSICAELSAEPGQSWMVGDYRFDIESGVRAGTGTILMIGQADPPPFADQADHVIRRLEEVLPIVEPSLRPRRHPRNHKAKR